MAVFDDLKGLVEQSGVTAGYQFRSILRQQDESASNESQRFIIMRRAGLPSDEFYRRFSYGIQVLGQVNDTGIAQVEQVADDILKHLAQSNGNNCLIGTNILSDVAGVYFTDSNRPYFLFEVEVFQNI